MNGTASLVNHGYNILTKTTAAQYEDALSYLRLRVRGLYHLAVVFVTTIGVRGYTRGDILSNEYRRVVTLSGKTINIGECSYYTRAGNVSHL